jgi:hypothetical protein
LYTTYSLGASVVPGVVDVPSIVDDVSIYVVYEVSTDVSTNASVDASSVISVAFIDVTTSVVPRVVFVSDVPSVVVVVTTEVVGVAVVTAVPIASVVIEVVVGAITVSNVIGSKLPSMISNLNALAASIELHITPEYVVAPMVIAVAIAAAITLLILLFSLEYISSFLSDLEFYEFVFSAS